MSIHSEHSSHREKLLEHLFIGEVLRYLWCQGVTTAEFLRPEVDSGGYDIVIACNSIIRHIQLKSSYRGAKTARQNVNLRLAEKPSGCVVWMMFDKTTLAVGPFLWFGGLPGQPLPDIHNFQVAKHAKGNAQGVKAEKPNIRVLNRGVFDHIESIPELVERLFGAVDITRERVDELLRFLPGLNQEPANGAFTMPYPTYPPTVKEFFQLAGQECWCDFEYEPSAAGEMVQSDAAIASASLAQIKTMLTYCVRGERFCDGHWDEMVREGRIGAILRRLSQLRK